MFILDSIYLDYTLFTLDNISRALKDLPNFDDIPSRRLD